MADADLDRIDRAIVNAFQGGFPVVEDPYEPAAAALREHGVDVEADELCDRIRDLVETGVLSRFGALIDADTIGGATTLVAMSVPDERFDEVAETVNGHREVAHNYERDHELNMWFVISVVDPDRIPAVVDEIERETGLDTYRLPKLQEFELGARFPVEGPLLETPLDLSGRDLSGVDASGVDTSEVDTSGVEPPEIATDQGRLSDRERAFLLEIQEGFPLTPTPYGTIAAELGEPSEWVVRTTRLFLESGAFRRVGVIPNHYALGYTENPMTVWDVPDDRLEAVGTAIGSLSFVTHCYERPRHGDTWPYNLFAMVHGRSTEEAAERVDEVRAVVEDHCGSVDNGTLNSTRILKKTGLRLAERTATASGS